MTLQDEIHKRGFRHWYERQLIEGHAYFVTCFLCLIVVAASLESFSLRLPPYDILLLIAIVFGCGALGVFSLLRYRVVLERAERIGGASTCGRCGTYGRLTVIDSGDGDAGARSWLALTPQQVWLKVRCRKCDHQWRIG